MDAVTGGGLVALVDPTRGLRSLWRGPVRIAGVLQLRWGDRLLHPAAGARLDGAGWERRVPLPAGGDVIERGVLVDSAPALLLHWQLAGENDEPVVGTIRVELQPPAGRSPLSLEVRVEGEGGAWVALFPPDVDPKGVSARLRPPAARERARRERGGGHGKGLSLTVPADGSRAGTPTSGGGAGLFAGGSDLLGPALRTLNRAPLGLDADGRPTGPFLLGVEAGEPRFAGGGALAEVGLGLLQAGRSEAAWAALELLLHPNDQGGETPPVPALHLATELSRWTGEARRLLPLRAALDRLLDRISPSGPGRAGSSRSGAAFPGPSRVVASFASEIERLGQGWKAEVEARRRPVPSSGKGMALPVVGSGPVAEEAPDRPASLPHPDTFQPVETPGLAPRRALHAARLVRSWVEDVLGVEPEAAYGRIRLAPDLRRAPAELRLRRLRVGDARIGVDCRVEGRSCSFALFQEGGRVPVNLVFAPRLPLPPPLRVRIGDDEVEVTLEEVDGGSEIRCQFPLDPERRMIVERRS